MRTLDDVFNTWETLADMASAIGEKPKTVEKWSERQRIPNRHWPTLLTALRKKDVELSADDLLAMHFPKSRRSAERMRA